MKKLYLYLGLLGAGLMLGSFSALISRNTGGTFATGTCYTPNYYCPDGYQDNGSGSGTNACIKYTDVIQVTKAECAANGGVLVNGVCWDYVTTSKLREACNTGYTWDSTSGKCCQDDPSDSDCGVYTDSSTRSECLDCTDPNCSWSFTSNKCYCSTVTTCDDYSSTSLKSSCNNCENNFGVWDFDNSTCTLLEFSSCSDYYDVGADELGRQCELSGNGKYWDFTKHEPITGSCEFSTDCAAGEYCYLGVCTTQTSCSQYNTDSLYYDQCNKCESWDLKWNFKTNSCLSVECDFSTDCAAGYFCNSSKVCQKRTTCSQYGTDSLYYNRCSECESLENHLWDFFSEACYDNTKGCTNTTDCAAGYFCNGAEVCQKQTSCNEYVLNSLYYNQCKTCVSNWSFETNKCNCTNNSQCGDGYACSNGSCVVDDCSSDSECGKCKEKYGIWDSGACTLPTSCNDYRTGGYNALASQCSEALRNGNGWDFTNHKIVVCESGYTLEASTGKCVRDSSTGTSKSGYYFINSSGQCSEYPSLPGYCIQPGTLYYSNAEYYACDWSLSCEQAAAAYYGNSGGAAFYTAQGSLNGRTYYTDSNCTNALATTGGGVSSEASKWCNTKPSFDGNVIALKVGESVTLTDANGVLGEYSVSSSSGALSVSVNGNTLSITANKETSGADIILSKGSRTPYQAYCSSTSQAYAIASALPYVTAGLSVYTTNETVEDTYGGFKIIKKSDVGTVLEGVKFKIGTNVNGEEGSGWKYYSTDSNGQIEISNIKTGTKYYYQEVETLDGYILDNQVHNLTIKANTVLEVEVINYSDTKAMFKLIKTNEGGVPLPGVKFKIGTDLKGTEGTDWSYMLTNESGYITIGNIDLNTKYYYQEVETLDGYVVDDQIREIIIDGTNGIYVVTVVNYSGTSATIIKKDAKTGAIIRNVEFEIYSSDNTLLYTKKTDKDGKLVIQGIENGKYYAKEKEAPDGYLLNKDKHYFEISDSNKNVVITIKNVPDNPDTGSIFIYTTMIIGAICLGVSIYQYRKLKNVEFM